MMMDSLLSHDQEALLVADCSTLEDSGSSRAQAIMVYKLVHIPPLLPEFSAARTTRLESDAIAGTGRLEAILQQPDSAH